MKTRVFLFISVLLLATLACNAIVPQEDTPMIPSQPQNNNLPQTDADVPRISVSEAKAAIDSGQAVLVDVRSAQAYDSLHATDAISIPLDVFETNISSVPLQKTDWIITYCT